MTWHQWHHTAAMFSRMYLCSRAAWSNSEGSHFRQGSDGVSAETGAVEVRAPRISRTKARKERRMSYLRCEMSLGLAAPAAVPGNGYPTAPVSFSVAISSSV